MAWNMTPVKDSTARLALEEVDKDAAESVEEAFAFITENPESRLIVRFDSPDARDEAALNVKSYCEARPAGKLTASIWYGFASPTEDKFSSAKEPTKACTAPALSMSFKVYVKRERTAADAEAAETPAES